MDATGGHLRAGRSVHGRIDDIEVLRALAMALIMVQHAAVVLIPWMSWKTGPVYGQFGFWSSVDLFFAVSGFVIGRSLLPTLPPASDRRAFFRTALSFWVRRAWRLWPAAWLWLAVALAATVAFNRSGAFGPIGPNVRCSISAVLGLANLHFARTFLSPQGGGMMLHYWTLSLEEQFYLVLPFLVFFTGRRLPIVLALIVAVEFCLKRMGPGSTLLSNVTRCDALALGVLLAIWSRSPLYARLEPRFLKPWIVRLVLPIALTLILARCARITEDPSRFLVGENVLVAAFIVWIASYDGDYLLPPGRLKRAACWMGARSYGMYLLHVPVYLATREIWFRVSPGLVQPGVHHKALLIATAVPLIFLLAELNFRFVEDPLRRRGARIAARMLQREPAGAPETVRQAA